MHYDLRPNRAEVRPGQRVPEHDVPLIFTRIENIDSIAGAVAAGRHLRSVSRNYFQDASWPPIRQELRDGETRIVGAIDPETISPKSFTAHLLAEIQELLHPIKLAESRKHFAGFTSEELAAELKLRGAGT